MIKKYWSLFVLISLVGILIFFTTQSQREYRQIKEKGESVNGEVRVFGSDIICSFSINGRKLERRLTSPNDDIMSGEKYKVYYYSEIPDKYYISFEEPILEDEDFIETSSLEVSSNGDYVHFSYKVGSDVLERSQQIFDNEIDENKVYQVFYNESEPIVAYLIF